jgi:hypothetical protein
MVLLKSGASRQEKASGCNGNGAPPNADIANADAIEGRLNRDAAGAEHLKALFEDDDLVAGRE